MVTTWIINATDPILHSSISHSSTARDILLDLEEHFAQTNAPRIHQLWRNLCLMQKNDELTELQPLPECTCGVSKELMRREEEQHLHLFLGSLDNEKYGHVKTSILNVEPLPSLRRAFNHVLREEARFTVEKEKGNNKTDPGTTFHSYSGNKQKRDGPKPKCDHCGKVGHPKSKCFELIRYPSNWDARRTNRWNNKSGGNFAAHTTHVDED